MDARGKFEEHEKCVRVARGAAESNSSFLSALLIPKCIHNSTYAQLKAWASDKVQNSHNAQKKVNKRPYWLVKITPHFILWFERQRLIHLTDNCGWKAQNLRGKWRTEIKAGWTQVSLKKCFKSQRPEFAGAGLPTNLRNVQLTSFFRLYFVAC